MLLGALDFDIGALRADRGLVILVGGRLGLTAHLIGDRADPVAEASGLLLRFRFLDDDARSALLFKL